MVASWKLYLPTRKNFASANRCDLLHLSPKFFFTFAKDSYLQSLAIKALNQDDSSHSANLRNCLLLLFDIMQFYCEDRGFPTEQLGVKYQPPAKQKPEFLNDCTLLRTV